MESIVQIPHISSSFKVNTDGPIIYISWTTLSVLLLYDNTEFQRYDKKHSSNAFALQGKRKNELSFLLVQLSSAR
jgi:hypothetical protein